MRGNYVFLWGKKCGMDAIFADETAILAKRRFLKSGYFRFG
jgi:hypothetical protein